MNYVQLADVLEKIGDVYKYIDRLEPETYDEMMALDDLKKAYAGCCLSGTHLANVVHCKYKTQKPRGV